MDYFLLEKFASLIKVPIIIVSESGKINFQSSEVLCPFVNATDFQQNLLGRTQAGGIPLIYVDDFDLIYCVFNKGDECLILGPVAFYHLDKVARHKVYKGFGVEKENEMTFTEMSEGEILNAVIIISKIFLGKEISKDEILKHNDFEIDLSRQINQERSVFEISSEEEDVYRHTYQEERFLLDMVRGGNVKEAIKQTRRLDDNIGKLSTNEIAHWKNLLVVSATLCARAAIEGGVPPYAAYRISGFYINKGTTSDDVRKIISYRNKAVEELTTRVYQQQNTKTSNYTQLCVDYISKHYQEKIYLNEIAENLNISESYLSRIFRREKGIQFQDYVVQVRLEKAANLLIYSNESISRIAEYVNFPSQSYFGKLFKEKYKMTPKKYRELKKPTEFIEN